MMVTGTWLNVRPRSGGKREAIIDNIAIAMIAGYDYTLVTPNQEEAERIMDAARTRAREMVERMEAMLEDEDVQDEQETP